MPSTQSHESTAARIGTPTTSCASPGRARLWLQTLTGQLARFDQRRMTFIDGVGQVRDSCPRTPPAPPPIFQAPEEHAPAGTTRVRPAANRAIRSGATSMRPTQLVRFPRRQRHHQRSAALPPFRSRHLQPSPCCRLLQPRPRIGASPQPHGLVQAPTCHGSVRSSAFCPPPRLGARALDDVRSRNAAAAAVSCS